MSGSEPDALGQLAEEFLARYRLGERPAPTEYAHRHPDLADQILGSRYGYSRPAGGFCVWLDVSGRGGDEAATVRLYRDAGVRVIPGSYLARQQPDGSNPGAGYIRLALVADSETTAEALHRLVEILD